MRLPQQGFSTIPCPTSYTNCGPVGFLLPFCRVGRPFSGSNAFNTHWSRQCSNFQDLLSALSVTVRAENCGPVGFQSRRRPIGPQCRAPLVTHSASKRSTKWLHCLDHSSRKPTGPQLVGLKVPLIECCWPHAGSAHWAILQTTSSGYPVAQAVHSHFVDLLDALCVTRGPRHCGPVGLLQL